MTFIIYFRYGFMNETDISAHPLSESRIRLEVLRRREIKWLDMIAHWDSYMRSNYKKVRERCRKGIPGSIRCQAWSHLCGAEIEMKKRADTQTEFKRLCVSIFFLSQISFIAIFCLLSILGKYFICSLSLSRIISKSLNLHLCILTLQFSIKIKLQKADTSHVFFLTHKS